MTMVKVLVSAMLLLCVSLSAGADACSRLTYADSTGTVITGRTMDWQDNIQGEMHVFRRGVVRHNLAVGSKMPTWTVKYGSVGIRNLGATPSSAVNEKGLVLDFLWLGCSDYGKLKKGETAIALSQLEQYLLDTCATVDEVVSCLKNEKIRPVLTEREVISGHKMTLHIMATDKTGNNAVIEWVDGKLNIHKQKGKMVMTNDPDYEKMLAIRDYYRELGIENNMPGSSLSQARFVYIDGWLNQMLDKVSENYISGITGHSVHNQKLAGVMSIIRGVSTPVSVVLDVKHPNNTSTIWRTMADLTENVFYYDSALANTFAWVDVSRIDFTKEKNLPLSDGRVLNGDITDLLMSSNE
ncbi:MAG: linear amide C-N hydrolase [Synergistes sp.]|nr:linear amide C-N hydrolase [Synergistes sp.]